jgi:hypothetical protein
MRARRETEAEQVAKDRGEVYNPPVKRTEEDRVERKRRKETRWEDGDDEKEMI